MQAKDKGEEGTVVAGVHDEVDVVKADTAPDETAAPQGTVYSPIGLVSEAGGTEADSTPAKEPEPTPAKEGHPAFKRCPAAFLDFL